MFLTIQSPFNINLCRRATLLPNINLLLYIALAFHRKLYQQNITIKKEIAVSVFRSKKEEKNSCFGVSLFRCFGVSVFRGLALSQMDRLFAAIVIY